MVGLWYTSFLLHSIVIEISKLAPPNIKSPSSNLLGEIKSGKGVSLLL